MSERHKLKPGERLLFEAEKLEVVRNETGGCTTNHFVSPEAKVYIGASNETFVQDGDTRVITLGNFVIYQELNGPPTFITPNAAYTPDEAVSRVLNSPSDSEK